MSSFIRTKLKYWMQIFMLDKSTLDKFVFRGQCDSIWPLKSSLERAIEDYQDDHGSINWGFEYYEKWMLHEFKRKYLLYSSASPDPNDLFEWLSIMQHYGAPTRLLDFTESLFIALYFAVIDSKSDAAIWLVNKHRLRDNLKLDFKLKYEFGRELKDEINLKHIELANSFIADMHLEHVDKAVIPLEPKICTERLSKQQGLFLMSTSSEVSFEQNLFNSFHRDAQFDEYDFDDFIKLFSNEKPEPFVVKIEIPQKLHKEIIAYLSQMNITAEILFPGLDGLAKSLVQREIRG